MNLTLSRRRFVGLVSGAIGAYALNGCKGTTIKKPNKNLKPFIYFVGDSLTRGIGTTGTGSSAGSDGAVGNNTYPKQTIKLLGGLPSHVSGVSGSTADGYADDYLDDLLKGVKSKYYNIAVIFFGANDLIGDSAKSTFDDLKDIHLAFKELGASTIAVSVLNRLDKYATQPDFDVRRLEINKMIARDYHSFADGFADLSHYPEIYASDAPKNSQYFAANDVDGLSGVHLTDLGAGVVAKEVAKQINLLLS